MLDLIQNKKMQKVGFEPTPFRNRAQIYRLRPLGHFCFLVQDPEILLYSGLLRVFFILVGKMFGRLLYGTIWVQDIRLCYFVFGGKGEILFACDGQEYRFLLSFSRNHSSHTFLNLHKKDLLKLSFSIYKLPQKKASHQLDIYNKFPFPCNILINEQMLGQRRANELDNFIQQNQQNQRMISPRNLPFNNVTNNYYSNGYQDHRNNEKYQRNISPNVVNNVRKPMISPVRSPRNIAPVAANQKIKIKPQDTDRTREYNCSNENHKNKRAEYIIHIEDEDMYYCGVCATQAASQGFTVNRINALAPSVPIKRQKIIPHYPNYMNNKRYHQLTELMGEIIKLQNEFKKKDPKQLKDHYTQQQVLLNDFYDELIEVVEKMRKDHLQDFKVEESKNIGTSQMTYENLQMHMDDLNSAWDDIEETMQDVVEKIDASSYEEGIRAYRNTVSMFRHKIEEFEDSFEEFTVYDQRSLKSKVKKFEDKLLELWNDETIYDQPTQKRIPEKNVKAGTLAINKANPGTTLKNVHEMLPKSNPGGNQGQGAFRNLFPDDDAVQRLPEASPQFKAF